MVGEGATVKEGKAMGIQKQQQQHQQQQQQQQQHNSDVFNMEGNLSFLEQSIADLDSMSTSHIISTSSSSILGNLPLPNLFPLQHVKQEVDFGLEKDLATYGGHVGLDSQLDSGMGSHLMDDSQIWNDLELSNSLPDISDFELENEVAHLDNVLHEGSGGGGGVLLTEGSPACVAEMCPGVNGAGQLHHQLHQHPQPFPPPSAGPNQHPPSQQQAPPPPMISSVVIKEEKDVAEEDSFVRLCTPGVVKQEKLDAGDHCQSSCFQSRLGGVAANITGTSTGSSARGGAGGSAFDYRGAGGASSPAAVLRDQKPFGGVYSNLPLVGSGWARGNGYAEVSAVMGRCDGLSSSSAGVAPFPLGFPR